MNVAPRLLMIDDSKTVHHFLNEALADEGVEVFHAFDPDEGFASARTIRPDLILLDVVMPKLSGFDLCRRLKQEPSTVDIPIIFLSGAGDPFNKIQGLDLGAVDYVVKPFNPGELQARVRSALRTKRLVDMLSELAEVDALTGLRNRLYFDRRLTEGITTARRTGAEISLLMMDIDNFKHCNDSYGHPVGDRVLKMVADTVHESVRCCDVACRYGGEEFAVIFPGTTLDDAAEIAEHLRSEIGSRSFNCRDGRVAVTVSGGVASTSCLDGYFDLPADFLVQAADSALYRAKDDGRNRIRRVSAADAGNAAANRGENGAISGFACTNA